MSDISDLERSRLDALDRLDLVGTAPEERFDRITRLAMELFDVSDARVNLVGETQQFTKSPQSDDEDPYRDRVTSFCEVTIEGRDILVVEDATKDDRFSWRVPVVGPEHVRFYAGRPLSSAGGMRVGSLCLVDTEPRRMSATELALLDELGEWVERELRSEADRSVAASIQRSLLPNSRPFEPEYDLSAACSPAGTLAGDFYDWTVIEDTLTLTVADVMGKGDGSAILAALVRATFAAQVAQEPAAAVREVNAGLLRDFEPNGSFATLVHARLHAPTGSLHYADAGHGLSLILRADGSHERLSAPSLPVGILQDGEWSTQSTTLGQGDTLVIVTDGVLDAFGGTLGALHDIGARVRSSPTARDALAAVLAAPLPENDADDRTIVVLRRC